MKSSSDIPWTRSIMAAILDLKCLPLTWQLSPHFWETLISWHSPRLTSCASKTNNYYHPLHFRPESAMSNRPTKAFVFLLLPLSFWCNWQGKDTAIGNGRPSAFYNAWTTMQKGKGSSASSAAGLVQGRPQQTYPCSGWWCWIGIVRRSMTEQEQSM